MKKENAIDKYLKRLATGCPVPGGGSAAALVGAISVALLSMVVRYMGRKAYAGALSKRIPEIMKFCERSQRRLKSLMREDEKAYSRLSKRGKSCSQKYISRLYKKAAEVPMEVCRILHEGLDMCAGLSAYCKTSIITDLIEAAILMEAGFLSAEANVQVNLGGIKNTAYTRAARSSLSRLRASSVKSKRRVLRQWKPR